MTFCYYLSFFSLNHIFKESLIPLNLILYLNFKNLNWILNLSILTVSLILHLAQKTNFLKEKKHICDVYVIRYKKLYDLNDMALSVRLELSPQELEFIFYVSGKKGGKGVWRSRKLMWKRSNYFVKFKSFFT